MRILPLGGAHEVGASSTIVEFGAYRFLIDAGIRIGASGGEQLPDLSRIKEEAGPIDAILLTHAHMDHSGALPLVHMAYPEAPIYMTPATFAVLRILFSDSQRQMQERYTLEGEIPIYPSSAMDSCLGRIRPVPFDYPLRLSGGEVAATFHPAGHILGASAIHLQGRSGSLLMSGDISVTDQRTVPGMLAPQIKPDVVMIESTYGDRLHAHRPTQEANLVQTVHHVLGNGGKVIIPAFAVGRAQEVILILRHAIAQGELPPFPIFVDGMVQSVCDTYSRFPTYLQQHLRRSVQRGDNPFFPSGGTIHRVRSQAQRERIIEGPPCCIIASSGMMTGGPSAFYAAALAQDKRNLIAITGYQDEEAPGRRLIELADAPAHQRSLRINDRDIQVACQVEKYSLSAHADSGEIAGLVSGLDPAQGVVLVHGDGDARESLAQMVDHSVRCDIYLPQNGEALHFQQPRRAFYAPTSTMQVALASPKQPLDASGLSHLHQALWSESGQRGLFRTTDLYARWHGPDAAPETSELETLQSLIADHPQFFQPDTKRPQLYRLTSPEHKAGRARKDTSYGRAEMNRALQLVGELLPTECGLYKKGARREEHILLLFFHFPQKAQRLYGDLFAQIEQKTGWKIQLNEMPHHAALEEHARRLLPEGWLPQRNPSILHEEQLVRLRVYDDLSLPPAIQETTLERLQQEFAEETGYQLELQLLASTGTQSPEEKTPPCEAEAPSLSEPLEINQAYQRIEEAFAGCAHRPYKKSKKGDKIVLSFLSPFVGERYQGQLASLTQQTGWQIQINPEPNQYGIKQEVRALLPKSWGLSKEPGIHKQSRVVRVQIPHRPEKMELQQIMEEVFERTGFHLEVRHA
ncbi:MAG: MBL fold metallo-hydrolase [Myxococcales bacterium]|nr:MBL fold metallo-hydrolase [Myxococcales bacterium]